MSFRSAKVPSPFQSRTVMVLAPSLTTTRVRLAVAIQISAVASATGKFPTALSTWSGELPSPLPSSTETLFSSSLTTARSGRPSPLKSAVPTKKGLFPI